MTSIYRTITGRSIELSGLTDAERGFLKRLVSLYRQKPHWNKFAAQRGRLFDELGLPEPETSPAYRIAQDLEARLGIAQGKVAPPDYRDHLADLIEARFGSRYRFCKETGVDAGHLSRVLAGRSNLSVEALGRILDTLQAVMVFESAEELVGSVGMNHATEALALL